MDAIDCYQWRVREVRGALDDAFEGPQDLPPRELLDVWHKAFKRINRAVNISNAAVVGEITAERRQSEPNWTPPSVNAT